MDKFQEDVYQFIFSLFVSEEIKEKCEKLLETLKPGFFEERASKVYFRNGIKFGGYHQDYEGGLADHVALSTLEAYHSVVTKPWLNINPDEILVVALFHDTEKIGHYTKSLPQICHTDKEVIQYIEKFGLRNNNTQDGILLAHGGWVPKELQGIEHPPIAIIAHMGDMLASHATKSNKDTREQIITVMKRITDMLVYPEVVNDDIQLDTD